MKELLLSLLQIDIIWDQIQLPKSLDISVLYIHELHKDMMTSNF